VLPDLSLRFFYPSANGLFDFASCLFGLAFDSITRSLYSQLVVTCRSSDLLLGLAHGLLGFSVQFLSRTSHMDQLLGRRDSPSPLSGKNREMTPVNSFVGGR
jgi:hypothetical protein